MQRDVCTAGIEGLSIGSFNQEKYTTWVESANKLEAKDGTHIRTADQCDYRWDKVGTGQFQSGSFNLLYYYKNPVTTSHSYK